MSQNGCNRGDGGAGGGGGGVTSVNGDTGAVVVQAEHMYVFDNTATETEINAAIAAAHAAGGGTLHFKPGLYTIDASWEGEGVNNITIEGEGDGTILQPQAGVTWTNSSVLNFLGLGLKFSKALNNVSAGDTTITLTSSADAAGLAAGDWVTFQGTDLDGLQDSEAHFITAVDGGTGVLTLATKVLRTMTSVNASDFTRRGINNTFRNFKMDMSLTDVVGSHWGLYLNNTYANKVSNVTFVDALTNGHTFLRMNTSPYSIVEKCRFTSSLNQFIGASVCIGNIIKDNVFDKITQDPVMSLTYVPSDVKIINNVFRNCNDDGFKMGNTNGSGKRITLIGNNFENCVGFGINLVGGAGHVIQGNSFHGIGNGSSSILLSGAQSCTVTGNTLEHGGLMGVWMSGANCKNNTVTGNAFHQQTNRVNNGAQAAAIYCDNAVRNDLRNNSYDNTAGAKYVTANSAAGNLCDDVVRAISSNSSTADEDTIIHVDSSGGAVALDFRTIDITTMPGKKWIIKDSAGSAATNNITITTAGSETIDGAASVVISANYGVAKLYTNGTNLFTL